MGSVVSHGFSKLHGLSSSFDLDVTSECLEFVNVLWSIVSFNSQQLYVEVFLVALLQERNQERASLEHTRFKDGIQESLVIMLSAQKLLGSHSFFAFLGERRDDGLGELSE